MEKKIILEVNNLSVLIKERFLVKNVSFSVEEGSCVGIIGEDESGKTSLIKAVSAALPISDGQVYYCSKDVKAKGLEAVRDIGLCLDPPVFFKYQTVMDNMQYLSMLSEKNDKENIIKVLNKFNIAHKMKKKVLFLSYYEKKLMALALAFLTEPKLLILDEPFKSLPPERVTEIRTFIEEIKAKGTTIIISSRNYESVEDLCDKFIFMENKSIKETLTKKECNKYSNSNTYAFIKVKYPHYCGELVINNFGLKVKVFNKRILFEADEDTVADIVKFLTRNRIAIYKAGYLSRKTEKIFASLAPYFKEEEQ